MENGINKGGRMYNPDQYAKIMNHIKVRITDSYSLPPAIIYVGDVPVGTLGNFSATVGKPKSGKTFNISAIVASALCGDEVLRYKTTLPPGKSRVLYFDTEQSAHHCQKVLSRILQLANLPQDKECDNLDFYMLREYSPEERCDIIDYVLSQDPHVGLVIVDGIRDLLRDINSSSESLDVINSFMKWSSLYQLHIHTALHLNKADDHTRGHIGTELNNKAEAVMSIMERRDISGVREIRAMHVRDMDFVPFAFKIEKDSLPHIVGEYSHLVTKKDARVPLTKLSEDKHRKVLDAVFADCEICKGYDELIQKLASGYSSIGYTRGRNTIVGLLKYLKDCGAVVKSGDGYTYNKGFNA